MNPTVNINATILHVGSEKVYIMVPKQGIAPTLFIETMQIMQLEYEVYFQIRFYCGGVNLGGHEHFWIELVTLEDEKKQVGEFIYDLFVEYINRNIPELG
jgi:hypothetical protein